MNKRSIMLGGGLITGLATTLAVNPLAQGLGSSPLASATPVAATKAIATSAAVQTGASKATRTISGSAVTMPYGTVQVQLTVSGKTITGVNVLQAPSGRNQQFTDYAVPTLTQEVLSAQTANVSIVSGATFVSDAFLQSTADAIAKI